MRSFLFAFAVPFIMSACGEAPSTSTLAGDGGDDFDWRANVRFTSVPERPFTGNDWGSAYYKDIMGHAERKITSYTPTTNGHETNHMLNNEARNRTSENDNTVYWKDGKAAMVLEPRMRAEKIRDFVPQLLKTKSSKYQLYLVQQTSSWPNTLYQFDEWSGYRTDASIAGELAANGNLDRAVNGEVCINDGAVEFLYFGSAAVAALAQNEPEYLRDNLQFKAAYAMLAEQSAAAYRAGRGNRTLDCDGTQYFEHFVSSPDNARVRDALKGWLGAGYTARVFGF